MSKHPGPVWDDKKTIAIDGTLHEVWGDTDYLGLMGDAFEPDTVDILKAFL